MSPLAFVRSFGLRRPSRGQALVETALLLPVMLILLLGTIDFGRLFFSYVNIHQAARIGANYAGLHPNMTSAEQDEFANLIVADLQANDCADAPTKADLLAALAYHHTDGTAAPDPELGDYAELSLQCDFDLLIPLSDVFFGETIEMRAASTFPVRGGCINCAAVPPATPPPTPDYCRLVPNMLGMSVAGAREAWASAGFSAANFSPATGQETLTVTTPITVTEDDPLSTCTSPYAIFSSSVEVTVAPPDATSSGCATVPNLVGVTVAAARDAWTAAGFTGGFVPPDQDAQRVISQDTTPTSEPGITCLVLDAAVEVQTGAPWPAPPPAPCKVPNLIDLRRDAGALAWSQATFTGSYSPTNGNFTIKSQSLVGGSYVPCGSSITVSAQPTP
jgi:hypothetical protein